MGIVSISDTKGSRALSWSGQAGRQYTLEVLVVTNDPTMGPRAVLKALSLQNGMYYRFPWYANNQLNPSPTEWDYASFIQSLDLKEEANDGCQWRATLQFGPFDWSSQGGFTGSGDAADGVSNPFAIPPQVKWSSAKFEKACTVDIHGNPIVNTVGDPFDPPVKRDDSRPILTVTQNQMTFDIGQAQSFKDTVNADTFCGFPPNSVKCADITADRQYSSDWGYYWQVTYEFEIRPVIVVQGATGPVTYQYGWTEQILNAGYRYASVTTGTPQPVLVSGAPVSSPVCLTQSGQYVPGNSPCYLNFDLYPQSAFAGLPIDQTILSVGAGANPGGVGS